MKISIKQLMLTSVLSFVFTLPAIAADATAVNAVDATSGSSALAASQSGVNSSIRSGVVGVGNNQGDVNNTTATTTATNQGQYQGNTGYNDQGQAQKQQQLQTQNGANNGQDQGQALTVNGAGIGNNYSTNVSHAADLSKAVGMSYAPALTTTLTETCMGSTSVGAGFSGGAFSFGTTWRDHACVRRLDAREIKSFGDIQAAKEIMCDSDLVREAFKRVGRPWLKMVVHTLPYHNQLPLRNQPQSKLQQLLKSKYMMNKIQMHNMTPWYYKKLKKLVPLCVLIKVSK